MKTANGMSSTLGPASIGFGSGFKGGEGDGRSVPLNAASGAMGNRFEQSGGFGLLGGLLGNRPFGIIGADGARTGILADMFNGGGRGASGDTFQGGILSGLLNAIGIRPIGFSRTQQPQMTEGEVRAQMGNAPSVMAPSPASAPPAPQPAPMYSPPMIGFTPNVNTLSTPRPSGMGLGPDEGRAEQIRAFREMQRRALQAQGLL